MADASQASVITLDYNDLINDVNLSAQIEEAYGYNGIGLLTVKNVPTLQEKRASLLPIGAKLALLPSDTLEKYVHEESKYSFGWSHGKEKLEGVPDESKGSFYANPQFNRPVDDEALIAKHPAFYHPNIWPTEEVPELEEHFMNLGKLIVDVGKLVAKQVDRYIASKCTTYEANKLFRIIDTSKCCKARLLHYFARNAEDIKKMENTKVEDKDTFSSWCGWHNDHGSLTGLVSALFLDETLEPVKNSDPVSGLYARSRSSELIKVNIPVDHIAYQIGECHQVHSGGIVQATPHAVRGSSMPGVCRDTFAVFMEPDYDEAMTIPDGIDLDNAQSQTAISNLPSGISPIMKRWKSGMDFSNFTDATLNSYYEM